jgi:hypothetical protein
VLINLVQDKAFIEQCIEHGAVRRVFDFLMHNVKQDTEDATGSSTKIIEDQPTEEGGKRKIYEVDGQFATPIQCAFMFLTNLSLPEPGQIHLLGEGKLKGSVLDNIFGMFTYFKTNTSFDFVSNILANFSSLKAGRRHLIEKGHLQTIFKVLMEKDTNAHRRKHLLATVRNCCFEYEDYEADFTQMDVLDKVVRLLVKE